MYPGTVNNPTYADMNVAISFPLWTDNWVGGDMGSEPGNDGS